MTPQAATRHILLAEDNRADEVLVREALLLNMHLPRHDGADILRTLRSTEHHSQKPAIVMSSSEAPGHRNTGGLWRKSREAECMSHHVCKLLILRGGTGGFACRFGFDALLPRAATGGEHHALYFFHKPSTLREFMLPGGIVRDVLDGLTSVAGGRA